MPFTSRYASSEPARADIDALGGDTLLEFGAPWCGHCIAAQSAIESALARRDIRHIKIEDGRGKPLGRSFRVKLWPTLVLLRDGTERARAVRPTALAEVKALLEGVGSSEE